MTVCKICKKELLVADDDRKDLCIVCANYSREFLKTLYELTAETLGVPFGQLGAWIEVHGEMIVPNIPIEAVVQRMELKKVKGKAQ